MILLKISLVDAKSSSHRRQLSQNWSLTSRLMVESFCMLTIDISVLLRVKKCVYSSVIYIDSCYLFSRKCSRGHVCTYESWFLDNLCWFTLVRMVPTDYSTSVMKTTAPRISDKYSMTLRSTSTNNQTVNCIKSQILVNRTDKPLVHQLTVVNQQR